MNINYQLAELAQIAKQIIATAKYKTLLFYGEMGAGKTTLIKEICKQLGVNHLTSSPTFSLVNEYQTNSDTLIYHFDFYRIKNEEEALDIGIEEYLHSENWCLIEWPENVENLLPLETISIFITKINEHQRNIKLTTS